MSKPMLKYVLGIGLLLGMPAAAQAQESAPSGPGVEQQVERAGEAVDQAASEVGQVAADTADEADDTLSALREELNARLEQSRAEVEELLKQTQSSTGLSDDQIYGIAAGIVAGALAADLVGGGGLVTITLAAGGAALGSWIAGEVR